jgi:formylglycine-generating enzyme required for sulfatase activity/serine/threonine protein phosphatase PrpC
MSSSSLTADVWPVTDAGRSLAQNADFVSVYHPQDPAQMRLMGSLYVVADANQQHERLSRYAAHAVMSAYYDSSEPDLGLRLRTAVEAVNVALFQAVRQQPDLMGVAKIKLAAAAIRGEELHVAAVGDVRAYLIRAGKVQCITHDHTLVQQLIDEGALSPEQARDHPRRDVVLRSLGAEEHVEIDLFDLRLKPDDAIVLCSDGLTRYLSDAEIGEIVSTSSPRTAAETLVNAANERGGKDNVTVVAALMRAGAPPTAGSIPHQWMGQRPSVDGTDTAVGMPIVPEPGEAPMPPVLPPSEQPTQSFTPVQAPRPTPQPQQAPSYGYIDPATGLPPVPPGQPVYQDRYMPRTYNPPFPSAPPRRGLSLTWVIAAGFLAVALTAIMVLVLSNPFGWNFALFGGQEAAEAITEPTATPTIEPPVQPAATPAETLPPTQSPVAPVGMVLIDGGPFIRGVTEEEANAAAYDCITAGNEYLDGDTSLCIPDYFTDAQPVEEVTLSPFFANVTEVTNQAYAECVAAGACDPPSDTTSFDDPAFAQHPVVYVTWSQAQAYCQWRGGRLPTEAEWEKLARGQTPRLYPWGDEWAAGRANLIDAGLGGTSVVRSFPQDVSPYGIYDLAGNVSEWTSDWYFEDYSTSGTLNPTGPANQPYGEALRVARGGSFQAIYPFARTGQRFDMNVDSADAWLGFRCVMDVGSATTAAEETPAEEAPAEAEAAPEEGAPPAEGETPADTGATQP